jgi:hypothetical protein
VSVCYIPCGWVVEVEEIEEVVGMEEADESG